MDVFLSFTMASQIMTELAGVVTEREMAAVILKAVCRLLKNNANKVHKKSDKKVRELATVLAVAVEDKTLSMVSRR
jgi:uncharacterized membrane protein